MGGIPSVEVYASGEKILNKIACHNRLSRLLNLVPVPPSTKRRHPAPQASHRTKSPLSFPAVVRARPIPLEQQVAQIFFVGKHFRHQPAVLPGIDEPSLLFDFSETYAADVLSEMAWKI